jgi:hypothetical protein
MFRGYNEEISVNNGYIAVNSNYEKIVGGTLHFDMTLPNTIESYTKKIYLKDNEIEKPLFFRHEINLGGVQFGSSLFSNLDIGEKYGELNISDIIEENFTDNLFFTFEYTTIDGVTNSSTIHLKVNEILLEE